jgi:hypothetical protein
VLYILPHRHVRHLLTFTRSFTLKAPWRMMRRSACNADIATWSRHNQQADVTGLLVLTASFCQ